MKVLRKHLIIITGLFCFAHIIFDFSALGKTTDVILALFFLLLLIYTTLFQKWQGNSLNDRLNPFTDTAKGPLSSTGLFLILHQPV
ncbi:hypothetical protein GA0061096_3754 [Fictibacillus enclensis]|uniref:Uncharacterized protein n=1 Tax=Fictibacillus enclensis TaxID=1017270 RepID=A0A0V8J4V0_9BACL|nr:hypothetical protein [Fictibacillus enclensis]KSU82135.1 hypothetical protein AS030_17870 [Fictibacillus enclensis]SCC30783.1 hypothetical protein GA0061096_3754 [Fictibacillus enclensis]